MSGCHKCSSVFAELHDPESLEGLAKQRAVYLLNVLILKSLIKNIQMAWED